LKYNEAMKQKIQFFPITSFAVVMGLIGLTIAFGKFYHFQKGQLQANS